MNNSRTGRRLAALVVFAMLVAAPAAFSASVDPVFVAGNPTCSDYGLIGLGKDSSNVAGDYSDGTLSVHIDQDGTGGAITSWSSNIGAACQSRTNTPPPPGNNPPPANTTPPPGPAPAQQVAPAQDQAPGQLVLGERISGGAAKLLAATGCAGRPFNARVRGAGIARV